ncbi:MAG: dTMP kinase [Anaerolineae bacterium]|nr:dTMP kinase [Anaerolineae bacterium]
MKGNPPHPGVLLALEGIDQSGKKTLSALLMGRLREIGIQGETISFPDYTTPIGKELKFYLKGERDYPPQTRHLLFAANRWERKRDIEAWLQKGKVVLANRYIASGVAYGMAHSLEKSWLWNLEEGLPEPDQTFLIDIRHELSFARKAKERDLYEEQTDLLRRAREAYLALALEGNWAVLDGKREVESVFGDLFKRVMEILSSRGYKITPSPPIHP